MLAVPLSSPGKNKGQGERKNTKAAGKETGAQQIALQLAAQQGGSPGGQGPFDSPGLTLMALRQRGLKSSSTSSGKVVAAVDAQRQAGRPLFGATG